MHTLVNNRLHALIVILLITMSASSVAQSIVDTAEVHQAGLRVVEITTVNGEEPQGKAVSHPNGNNFNYIYTNKVPCQIVITLHHDTLYNSGAYQEGTSGATIRINGNTSAYYSNVLNMPYKLKLEKAADLLCRSQEAHYADKHWRLLKDAVSLNTIVGLRLSQLVGLEWTASYTPCNVIINGDYRGCYLLMETVKRNNKCRISVDKQQGYIVERDPYWWKEEHYFATSWYENANTYRWTWKYPDEEDITTEKELFIQQCINLAEQAIRTGGPYERHIDVDSYAKWLLAHDILGTRDSGGSNMYVKKYDESDSTLLAMPCLWDFDSSYEMKPDSFSRLHISANAYFSTLLKSSNKTFAKAYVTLWNELKSGLTDTITSFIHAYMASDEAKALDASRLLYNRRFNYAYPSLEYSAQQALQWFSTHPSLMDAQIQCIDTVGTSAILPVVDNGNKRQRYYDLLGRRTARPAVLKKAGINVLH